MLTYDVGTNGRMPYHNNTPTQSIDISMHMLNKATDSISTLSISLCMHGLVSMILDSGILCYRKYVGGKGNSAN